MDLLGRCREQLAAREGELRQRRADIDGYVERGLEAQEEIRSLRQQLEGAVEAVRAHRDRWYAVNSKHPREARPPDRELWVAVLGSDLPEGQ